MTKMQGSDLTIFDFDYDLTWAAFFLNANGKIYGRYGGRDEGPAEKGLSLKGLKYAMRAALESHRRDPDGKPTPVAKDVDKVEKYAAAKRVKNCIHCHQVWDFRREALTKAGRWTRDEVWVYPPPANIGLELDIDQGDRIERVVPKSIASVTGLRNGDVLQTLNSLPIHSYGDVQYALHRSPKTGTVPVVWQRDGQTMRGQLRLNAGWRETDISWRASMWSLEPQAFVYGRDLTAAAKRKLGLAADRLAFTQGNFVPNESRKAGIRGKDIIIGIDGKELKMKMLQFNAWVRLNHKVGDRITFDVIRNGKPMKIPLTLTSRIRR